MGARLLSVQTPRVPWCVSAERAPPHASRKKSVTGVMDRQEPRRDRDGRDGRDRDSDAEPCRGGGNALRLPKRQCLEASAPPEACPHDALSGRQLGRHVYMSAGLAFDPATLVRFVLATGATSLCTPQGVVVPLDAARLAAAHAAQIQVVDDAVDSHDASAWPRTPRDACEWGGTHAVLDTTLAASLARPLATLLGEELAAAQRDRARDASIHCALQDFCDSEMRMQTEAALQNTQLSVVTTPAAAVAAVNSTQLPAMRLVCAIHVAVAPLSAVSIARAMRRVLGTALDAALDDSIVTQHNVQVLEAVYNAVDALTTALIQLVQNGDVRDRTALFASPDAELMHDIPDIPDADVDVVHHFLAEHAVVIASMLVLGDDEDGQDEGESDSDSEDDTESENDRGTFEV